MPSLADLLMQSQQRVLQPQNDASGILGQASGVRHNVGVNPTLLSLLTGVASNTPPTQNPVVSVFQQRASGSAYRKGNPAEAKAKLVSFYPNLSGLIDKPEELIKLVRRGQGFTSGAMTALNEIYGLTHIDGKSLTPGWTSEEFPDDSEKARRIKL